MRIGIKRSVAKAICKRWGFPLVLKSVKTRRQRFLEIKAALLKHCKQKLAEAQREEAALRKAIIGWERLEKAGAGRKREKADNGTIRTWGDGKKYRRVAPGKWLRVYQGNEEAESKGGVRAWKNIIKKLNAIDDERELMWFVQQNKMRFIDNRGYPLNVVEQLSELAELRNVNIIAKKSPEKIKELEDEAIEREGYEKQVADMKAKVNKYVNEEHSLEELRGLQAEAQALHDDIKAMNGSLNNRGSRLSALMRRAVIPLRQVEAAVLDAEEEHERQEAAAKELDSIVYRLYQFSMSSFFGRNRHSNGAYNRRYFYDYQYRQAKNVVDNFKQHNVLSQNDANTIHEAKQDLQKQKTNAVKAIAKQFGKDAAKWVVASESERKNIRISSEESRIAGSVFYQDYETADMFLEKWAKIEALTGARESKPFSEGEPLSGGGGGDGGEPSKTSGIDLIRQKYGATKAVDGDEDEIILPNGSTVSGRWRIVEASAPSASHDETTFQKTEGFPMNVDGTTINDRDYEHDREAQEAVLEMAANYDARAVSMDNPVVVSQDGVVISGNNRTMSSKLAAKKGSDGKYIDALKKRCKRFGVDPAELDKFNHPRVVFETEAKEGYSTKQFAAFNASDKKAQSPVEQAVKVAKTVRQDTVEAIAQKMDEYDTLGELYTDKIAMRGIFNNLCDSGVIQKTDVPAYYTEDYGLSNNGKEFLETVLIGSVMSANNVRALANPGGKAIRQKLVRAIVPLVENKGMKGYSISDELNDAVRIACYVSQHREEMPSVATYAQQQSLFGDKHDVLAIELAKKLDSKNVTQKEFASLMQSMNAGLRPSANGEVDIFLGRAETRGEVLSRVFGVNIEKALQKFPRLMVRKSVARRALRSPLPRLAFTKSGRLVVRR